MIHATWDGRVLTPTARLIEDLGWAEAPGDLIHPEDRTRLAETGTLTDLRLRHPVSGYRCFRPVEVPGGLVLADVTDLRSAQSRLRSTVQALPDLLFELDHAHRYVEYLSPRERLFAPPEDFLGKRVEDVLPPHVADLLHGPLSRVAAGGPTETVPYSLPMDGGTRHYLCVLVPTERQTILAVTRDVTELIETRQQVVLANDELRKRNRELEQFAVVASHDLQQPLRVVTQFMGMLRDEYSGLLDERGIQYVDFCLNSAARMRALISDLLEVSRAGQRPLEPGAVDLNAVATQVGDALAGELSRHGASLQLGDLPEVCADRHVVERVLTQLVGNACRFGRRGVPVEIRISATPGTDHTRVEVTDNGQGVRRAFQRRIFTIFQRLHGETNGGGNGMGLALCERLVEHMGGEIGVESDGSTGSTFWFTIPHMQV